MTEKIKPVLLVWTQLGADVFRQFGDIDSFEFIQSTAQFLEFLRRHKLGQALLVQVRCLLEADLLLDRRQAIDTQVRHRLLRLDNGLLVELHPTCVRQLYEAATRPGQLLQIAIGQFHTLLLPLGGDGQPVDAATADDQFRL